MNLEILSKRPVLSITPAIVAAATELGCTTLYSEDLSHSQFYGTVQGINPFAQPVMTSECWLDEKP